MPVKEPRGSRIRVTPERCNQESGQKGECETEQSPGKGKGPGRGYLMVRSVNLIQSHTGRTKVCAGVPPH